MQFPLMNLGTFQHSYLQNIFSIQLHHGSKEHRIIVMTQIMFVKYLFGIEFNDTI